MKKNKIKKTIKPSERDSITEFSSTFGSGRDYEAYMKRHRIITAVLTVVGIFLLISLGYLITETLIDFTELPPVQ